VDVSSLWNQRVRGKEEDSVCRPSVPQRPVGPSAATAQLQDDDKRDSDKFSTKVNRKRERDAFGAILDDVAPKETGREALLDKRREKGARLHGAARDADDGRDGLDLRESDVLGGGDDFESAKARMARSQQFRIEKKQERVRELQEKEQERAAHFMSQLGVDLSKGPIRIQPRSNP